MVFSIWDTLEKYFEHKYQGWEGAKQFEGTGSRVHKMYQELCWEKEEINKEVQKCLKATFEEPYDEMLVVGPTKVWTLCPHHLLPVSMKVHIGYIPNGKVLGLSKFSRLAILMGKRPIMQEMYSRELADTIWENLKPAGVGVFISGSHGCMTSRGVLQEPEVTTSILKGVFLKEPGVREEFLKIVRGGKD